MDSLPLEIRREILRNLDLHDLARCRRVSPGMKEGADNVLSTIRCVYHKRELSVDVWDSPYPFGLLNSAPKETMTGAEFSQKNMRSFLLFITTKCPRITSLIATNHSVCLEDIATLAPRLTYFSLWKIKKQSGEEDDIDAQTMVANFTNLQCYDLLYSENDEAMICDHVVAREYSLRPSNQFAQCDEICHQHDSCPDMVRHRSMKSLRSLNADLPLSLHELHPSSFNSLQFLLVVDSIVVPDNSPHFPNLLVAQIECYQNLNSLIRLLSFSPRLLAARLHGIVDEESVPAIDLLLSACSALQVFVYDLYRNSNLNDIPVYSLDFTRLKSIRSFTWDCYDVPLKVTLPPHCHQIVSGTDTVSFNIDGRSYAFSPSLIPFNEMNTFLHPVEVVISADSWEQSIVPLMRLCPQLLLTLSFKSEGECLIMVIFVLLTALGETNVSEITFVSCDEKERIYKSNLEKCFTLIGRYPDRPFSIKLRGRISCKLRSIIKAHIKGKFTIRRDNSKSPPETLVKILSSPYVPPPANAK